MCFWKKTMIANHISLIKDPLVIFCYPLGSFVSSLGFLKSESNFPEIFKPRQGLLQYGPITELIFWKSYLETKSSKVLVISFEHLQKLCIFAKFGRHSSKIEPATPISISKCFGRKFKFERTKSLQILSKVVSYCDLQLVKIWCWYLKPLLINSKITNFALTF